MRDADSTRAASSPPDGCASASRACRSGPRAWAGNSRWTRPRVTAPGSWPHCRGRADLGPKQEFFSGRADMKEPRIRVLLADDHILLRRGLASVLTAERGFEVVGEAGDGQEAVARAQDL